MKLKQIKNIARRPISWVGRINMLKMVILPKIIYKFQMLPIGILSSFFKVIKTIFLKYIWQNKKPRVNNNLLTRKKEKGGGVGTPGRG